MCWEGKDHADRLLALLRGSRKTPNTAGQGFQTPIQMVTEIGQGVSGDCRNRGDRCSFGGGRAGSDVGLVQGRRPRKVQVRVGPEGLQGCFGPDGAPCEENEGMGGPGRLCTLTGHAVTISRAGQGCGWARVTYQGQGS